MATRNSIVGSFRAFPGLVFDQNHVSGSWRKFSQDFVLAIELRDLELNIRYTNPRSKIVALLKAVRQESRDFLQSVGFDLRQGTYEEALDLLDDHYGKEENMFKKTERFCFVHQTAGEDERDYLVWVERLGRG